MSLATQVLIGFCLGIASGLFFGERIVPLGAVGDAFIRLLQMTVLPYVVVSLIHGLGRLSAGKAARLLRRAVALLILLWVVALIFVLLMPRAYPDWESSAFFSTVLVEPPPKTDFIRLFIPANPFESLALGVVPACVIFSLAMGAALIGVQDKEPILKALAVISATLSRVANFMVRLAPVGVFSVTAHAAGTLALHDLKALEIYLAVYLLFWLITGFWLLPMLFKSLIPIRYREFIGPSRDALVTAFATGSVFVVLPILADRAKDLVRRFAPDSEDAAGAVDVLVPLAFTFPSPGTLLVLGFVPFAAWKAGVEIAATQLPAFLISGLLSLFGSSMVAIPFLLDLLRIPADLFQLYVVSNVLTLRFGMLVSGIFMLTFSALGACALVGALRINKRGLAILVAGTGILVLVGVLGLRLFFTHVVSHEYRAGHEFLERDPLFPSAPLTPVESESSAQSPVDPESTIDHIRSRGVIRVGYREGELPFSFRQSSGRLVGHDVELAHLLSNDLGVRLQLVPVTREKTAKWLNRGAIDTVMSGVAVTPLRSVDMDFTTPYLDQTLAFVVPDHRRASFASREAVRGLQDLVVAVPDLERLKQGIAEYLPGAELVVIESPDVFFESPNPAWDALAYSAEAGSSWTLLHPEYCVAIPQPDVVRLPLAFPVAKGNASLRVYLNTWIDLKHRDGTLSRLYSYWILGEDLGPTQPRWCILRDVLGWVE